MKISQKILGGGGTFDSHCMYSPNFVQLLGPHNREN